MTEDGVKILAHLRGEATMSLLNAVAAVEHARDILDFDALAKAVDQEMQQGMGLIQEIGRNSVGDDGYGNAETQLEVVKSVVRAWETAALALYAYEAARSRVYQDTGRWSAEEWRAPEQSAVAKVDVLAQLKERSLRDREENEARRQQARPPATDAR